MTIHEFADTFQADRKRNSDLSLLGELVEILAPHPGGLRRWSVMRALRAHRDRASRPVSLKFEAEVERAFRAACANLADLGPRDPGGALFYRPEGKAGEVWAVHADRARIWLSQAQAPAERPRRAGLA